MSYMDYPKSVHITIFLVGSGIGLWALTLNTTTVIDGVLKVVICLGCGLLIGGSLRALLRKGEKHDNV